MKRRILSVIVAMATVFSMFIVTALAASSSSITVDGSRNSTSGWGRASCSDSNATETMVVVSVYLNGSRVKYLTNTGKYVGYIEFSGVSNTSMTVSSSAKINGAYYTGQTKTY